MDESTIVARLESLERRVFRLEEGVGARPARRAPPVPVRPVTVTPRPPAPAPAVRRDMESWFGAVLLGRVGIVAVLLAAGYFAQLAYRHVTDPLKVASLYGVAAVLFSVGEFLRSRVAARYVGLLWGGAAAVAYLAGIAATLRYHLLDPWVGLGFLVGAVAFGQALAHRLRQPVLAIVAVAAAQAAPLVLGVARDATPFVLVYAALVHAWAVFTERQFGWRSARSVALVGAQVVGIVWALAHPATGVFPALALQGYALLLLWPEIEAIVRDGVVAKAQPAATRLLLSLAGVAAIAHSVESIGPRAGSVPWLAAAVGGAWAAFAWLAAARPLKEDARRLVRAFSGVGAVVLAIGAPRALEGLGVASSSAFVVVALAGAAFLVLLLQRRTEAGDGGAITAALLTASWSGTIGARGAFDALPLLPVAGMATVFLGRHVWARPPGLLLAAGTVFAVFLRRAPESTGWVALALLASAALLLLGEIAARRRGDDVLAGTTRLCLCALALLWMPMGLILGRVAGLPPPLDPHTGSAVGLAAAALLAWWRTPEVFTDAIPLGRALPAFAVALLLAAGGREVFLATRHLPEAWPAVALSVYLTVAAGLLLVVGFCWRLPALRWGAIGLFGVVVAKVGLHDLRDASLPLRVLVTGVLGLVLLASAFAYSRRRKDLPGGDPIGPSGP